MFFLNEIRFICTRLPNFFEVLPCKVFVFLLIFVAKFFVDTFFTSLHWNHKLGDSINQVAAGGMGVPPK